ncbi:hypothetical protein [Syntrophotalea acetylenica]|nr:hypothetical protein [Syntrophotalea acetylenica]APG44053.1 hypothetical protein A6070_07970 [Syntrophotalea acetylenica]MDY0262948.1 hypothetical protein [Syntrophotalea acetylenica]
MKNCCLVTGMRHPAGWEKKRWGLFGRNTARQGAKRPGSNSRWHILSDSSMVSVHLHPDMNIPAEPRSPVFQPDAPHSAVRDTRIPVDMLHETTRDAGQRTLMLVFDKKCRFAGK